MNYKLLESKIGRDAAKLAVLNVYVSGAFGIIALATVAVFVFARNASGLVLNSMTAAVLIAVAVAIYAKVLLAKSISKYLKLKINWYSVPSSSPIEKFDIWLESVKAEARQ